MLQKLRFLLDINNRVYAHLLFWLVYYIYRAILYLNSYNYTIIVQLIELPIKILVVYLNLYVLMPFLLRRKKWVFYGLSLFMIIFLGAILQSEVIKWMIKANIYEMKSSFISLSLFPYRVVRIQEAGIWALNYFLYSPLKFSSTASHFVELIIITSFIKSIKNAYLNEQKTQNLERENLENELKFLKTQINPHFFFNTLNNLYALVLLKSDKASEVVLKLSDLMHYMLYETNQEKVDLEKEVNYLKNYIELEKLRFGEELKVDFKLDGNLSGQKIAPMLLLAIVENAFKHSKALENEQIAISLELSVQENGQLDFKLKNAPRGDINKSDEESNQGIGLKNTQRRLELIYPKQHQLQIRKNERNFEVLLTLQLKA
jgi:LytS/YehU family sensor histidine kinase